MKSLRKLLKREERLKLELADFREIMLHGELSEAEFLVKVDVERQLSSIKPKIVKALEKELERRK